MSFYNQTNPSNFGVVSDSRKFVAPYATITQLSVGSILGAADYQMTPQDLCAGSLLVNPTGTTGTNYYLPDATDLYYFLGGDNYVFDNSTFETQVINYGTRQAIFRSATGSSGIKRVAAPVTDAAGGNLGGAGNLTILFDNTVIPATYLVL
jgi:hypothetical protein